MSEFYQNLASGSLKAQALKESQIAMLKSRVCLDRDRLRSSRGTVDLSSTFVKKQYDLSHPFYWAGFSLIGNPLRSIYSIYTNRKRRCISVFTNYVLVLIDNFNRNLL